MAYKKGEGGRPKGAVNQTTKLVKEVFNEVFTELQTHKTANLKSWAITEPTEFYKLASKLIPAQMTVDVGSFQIMTLDPLNAITADDSTTEDSSAS